MTADPQTDAGAALRARLRSELVTAMKAKDTDIVRALRTAIAAIDNAEAIDVDRTSAVTDGPIAGARTGVGAAEAARRDLTFDEVRAIIGDQVAELDAEARRYMTLGRPEDGDRLRRQVDHLRGCVTRSSPAGDGSRSR